MEREKGCAMIMRKREKGTHITKTKQNAIVIDFKWSNDMP